MRRHVLVALALTLCPGAVEAQLTRLAPGSDAVGAIEVAKPFIEDSGLSWFTSVIRGRVLVPVAPTAYLIGDWGVSVASVGSGTDATFANPEIGIGFTDGSGRPRFSLTAVVPLAVEVGDDDISAFTGLLADIFHPERFIEELMSINAAFTPSARLGPSTSMVFDIGASALVPRGDASGDTEFLSRYGIGVEHDTDRLRLRGLVEGYAQLSGDAGSFSERTLHRLLLAIDGVDGGPGFWVQIPMDDALSEIQAVAGITFTF